MTEKEFEECLSEAMDVASHEGWLDSGPMENANIRSFEERGVLTNNRGFIVELPNGDEFQVTIVQSKFGEER